MYDPRFQLPTCLSCTASAQSIRLYYVWCRLHSLNIQVDDLLYTRDYPGPTVCTIYFLFVSHTSPVLRQSVQRWLTPVCFLCVIRLPVSPLVCTLGIRWRFDILDNLFIHYFTSVHSSLDIILVRLSCITCLTCVLVVQFKQVWLQFCFEWHAWLVICSADNM